VTFFFLIAAGIAYFLKAHVVALVFVGLSIAEQLLVMLRASIDPEWYIHRRIEANQDVDLMRPGKHVIWLIVTKVMFLWILGFFAYHVSREAGLF
jgi:hypothetical protein|tara:strand:+ start:1698 stop:1982 length:285 start_codon:yes stop_codon:yes gene_type:complete